MSSSKQFLDPERELIRSQEAERGKARLSTINASEEAENRRENLESNSYSSFLQTA